MSASTRPDGIIYTETVIFSPPERYAAEAPYQIAIIELDGGGRITARVLESEAGERARIGERVTYVEERDGVPFYRRTSTRGGEAYPAPC